VPITQVSEKESKDD